MASLIYFCTQENNTCPKKEECKRYMDLKEDDCHATLFKVSCTEDNDYILFMKHEKIKEEGENR